jgi:hypothetical protein
LNVDIDVKSVTDPGPFLQALGSQVLFQRIGKVGRAELAAPLRVEPIDA